MIAGSNADFIPVLQTAIGPVILISGIGLLLLTMTNRLGRVIDRSRILLARETPSDDDRGQLAILWLRARLLRGAILLASTGALCAAMLVILLFLAVLMCVELGWVIGAVFIVCMLAVIASLMLFYRDVDASLSALRLEFRRHHSAIVS